MRKPAIILLLIACSSPAFGVNVCTDSHGRRIYQDKPCPSMPTKAENQVQTTSALTSQIAQETVRRFHQALSDRDISAATGYLGDSFTATIDRPKGISHQNRDEFAKMLLDVLSAASQYHSTATCGEPRADGDAIVLQCEVEEQMVLLSKPKGGNSTETYRVVLEEGYARLAEIHSKQR